MNTGPWSTRCWLAVAFRSFPSVSAGWISNSSRPAPLVQESSTSATAWRANPDGGAARTGGRTRAGWPGGARSLIWKSRIRQCSLSCYVLLAAGRGRAAGTPFGCLVRALPVVPWTRCGGPCMWLVGPSICWRVGGTRDIPVEALFPEGRERFELGSSCWSGVLGIDAVGGPPHRDVADEGGAGVTSRYCPGWLDVTLANVV